ncbi:hypothetical protein ABIB83_005462 [Bradyrhizobium sp. I1.8.5]
MNVIVCGGRTFENYAAVKNISTCCTTSTASRC